jgi:hypothetical protein
MARHAGHLGVVEKAQALSSCKASVFFGAQVLRGREARLQERGERSSSSYKRTAVERTSVFVGTHDPSRGMREPEASAMSRPALARSEASGAGRTRERFRLS